MTLLHSPLSLPGDNFSEEEPRKPLSLGGNTAYGANHLQGGDMTQDSRTQNTLPTAGNGQQQDRWDHAVNELERIADEMKQLADDVCGPKDLDAARRPVTALTEAA